MRKPHRLIALALLTILTFSVPSYGWWGLGHMAVAYVAYQKLTPQKRNRVDVLLRLNPDLPNWLALLPPDTSKKDERLMIFMIAATWPDRIKEDSKYSDDSDIDGGNTPTANPPTVRILATMISLITSTGILKICRLRRMARHSIRLQCQTRKPRSIYFVRCWLRTSPTHLKSYDLSWLLHLVGDVHQPLHCTARFGNDEKWRCRRQLREALQPAVQG